MADGVSDRRTSELKTALKNAGACIVGVGDVWRLNLAITKEFPFGICFALRYDDGAIDALPEDDAWLAMCTTLAAKSKAVYQTAEDLIVSWRFRHRRIASGLPPEALPDLREELPQKTLATLAGLGWIGKSALLVSPDYGPRIRLGGLLTNTPLVPNAPTTESRCGGCNACVDACPVGAITGADWSPSVPRTTLLDLAVCYAHLSRTRASTRRLQTCGLCLKSCPAGMTERTRSG